MDFEIKKQLRAMVLGEETLVEAKSVDVWWEKLPGKLRRKVCDILGLDKGEDIKVFSKLSPSAQDEVASYFRKHKGRVEGVEGYDGEELYEDKGEDWKVKRLRKTMTPIIGNTGKVLYVDIDDNNKWLVVFDTKYAALEAFYKYRGTPGLVLDQSVKPRGWYIANR